MIKNVLPLSHEFVDVSTLEQSKKSFQELNFSKYNQTPYVGLENKFENSYLNAYIQVLYHIKPFRIAMMNHLCKKQFCLACELGFLFRKQKI